MLLLKYYYKKRNFAYIMDKNNVLFKDEIKKSNELSTAQMMQGLNINQMRMLAYAIYKTQQENGISFTLGEFEKRFNIQYPSKDADKDAKDLFNLVYETYNPTTRKTKRIHVFKMMQYGYLEDAIFEFDWHDEILPHILDLKERYIMLDLGILASFKSNYSMLFYEFIKGNYGKHSLELSKEQVLKLFNLQQVKSYRNNTAHLKINVLDKAISEINEYTEYWVEYDEIKRGRKIIGFNFKFRKTKPYVKKATDKQLAYMNSQFDNLRLNYSMELLDMKHRNLQEKARDTLKAIISKEISLPKELSSDQADEFIKEINQAIKGIEALIQLDKETPLNTDIPEFEPFHVPEFDWDRFRE